MVAGDLAGRATDSVHLVAEEELQERYVAYCRRQAARLVQMLPREAVRPLYRRAREEALRADALSDAGEDDPLALLVRYCQGLLPLPPFHVWMDDLRAHPDGHYADMEESVEGPTADAPSTMEVRPMTLHGRAWRAQLRSFRDAGLWRGYISFQEEGSERVHRTAAVFCEEGPGELRERFLSFESATLEAFLRSALP